MAGMCFRTLGAVTGTVATCGVVLGVPHVESIQVDTGSIDSVSTLKRVDFEGTSAGAVGCQRHRWSLGRVGVDSLSLFAHFQHLWQLYRLFLTK